MDIEKFEKGYLEFCESKSQPGYKWGVYSCDVFTYLRSSEFKNLNLHIVSGSINVGDSFRLKVKKPKCTVDKEYIVYKKVQEQGEKNEYWFFNDHDKPQTLYEGEYYR